MQVTSEQTVAVVLRMSAAEAATLKALVQNALCPDEPPESRALREQIFTGITQAMVAGQAGYPAHG